MTQHYIGAKQVTAWPAAADQHGSETGYAVKYADGYQSWSPREAFESAYLPMGEGNDGSRITREMVDDFILPVRDEDVTRMGNHTVVLVRLRNGFTFICESACVDPANYDEAKGRELAMEKAVKEVWAYLGFMLASARNGVGR